MNPLCSRVRHRRPLVSHLHNHQLYHRFLFHCSHLYHRSPVLVHQAHICPKHHRFQFHCTHRHHRSPVLVYQSNICPKHHRFQFHCTHRHHRIFLVDPSHSRKIFHSNPLQCMDLYQRSPVLSQVYICHLNHRFPFHCMHRNHYT